MSATGVPVRLVVVGAGPRAVMLLERLLARHPAGQALRVDLIDPHPPGAGRIWRHDQSPLLKLNSMARDVTVFTDDTCTIDGPVRPGPALDEWAALVRDGRLPDVVVDDEGVAAEIAGLRGDGFPTRRLHSHYLDWFWRTTVAGAPAGVEITWRQDRVTGVDTASPGHVVRLAGGDELPADVVVYATGHTASKPDAAVAALREAATAAGLTYVPPDFTADADLSALDPGTGVIVRGMGLAAIDLVVLLAEGLGGRFSRGDDGALRYEPSGLEPVLHLGSRRGVPYRSKVSSQLQGDAPVLEVVTPEAIAALVARDAPVDFERDVWPLIGRELVWAHYRELCTGHADRVRVSWAQFREVLAVWDGTTASLRAYVAQVVPDPLDRFDVAQLDRPLAGERFADA
ncbi:MAG TPA: FAD/NAD(P)-binding protein, partial [Microbacterium sp.]|nr:FAD/NAD(P)-binding protein [Microbacterium sp.]